MRTKHSPFKELASDDDMFYKLIARDHRFDMFWKAHNNFFAPDYFSADFKDLITNMLDYTAKKRLCIADIIGHPWLQGEIATDEQICQEFKLRE